MMKNSKTKSFFELVRYGVIGVCTTLVNFVIFYLLDTVLGLDANVANVISVVSAVIFAYVTNKLFVFQHRCDSFAALVREAVSFFSARGVTMLIEVGGVFIATLLKLDAMLSKIALNVIVLVLNYVFSKWFVFRKEKKSDE